MSLSDFIGDALTRVRNAQSARHKKVVVPFSRTVYTIFNVLLEEGYLGNVALSKSDRGMDQITIDLKYVNNNTPVIQHIRRISKPSLRVYASIKKLPLVRGGLGISILSTNKGVMTDANARKSMVGGEVICEVF